MRAIMHTTEDDMPHATHLDTPRPGAHSRSDRAEWIGRAIALAAMVGSIAVAASRCTHEGQARGRAPAPAVTAAHAAR